MAKIIIGEFIWESTLFCYLVQHTKEKNPQLFPDLEELVLEQSEFEPRANCASPAYSAVSLS